MSDTRTSAGGDQQVGVGLVAAERGGQSSRRTVAKRILPFAGQIFELMFGWHSLRVNLRRRVFDTVGLASRDEARALQDRIDRLTGSVRALERTRRTLRA